ncbi:MAG: hypothetical protein EBT92_13690 [Planctomycetes bacterium]|nr:hypothetical protein [Planctomycetota bacterium]
MIKISLIAFLVLGFEQPDTSIIRKKFDLLKSKGTAERVIAVSDGAKTTFFKRKFELVSYNIETTSTGNKVIPYFAVIKFRAKVKTSKEFETTELASNAVLINESESFLQWQAIYRLVKENWALENIVYRSSNGEIFGDLKNTSDAKHFIYDWFNALDGY